MSPIKHFVYSLPIGQLEFWRKTLKFLKSGERGLHWMDLEALEFVTITDPDGEQRFVRIYYVPEYSTCEFCKKNMEAKMNQISLIRHSLAIIEHVIKSYDQERNDWRDS